MKFNRIFLLLLLILLSACSGQEVAQLPVATTKVSLSSTTAPPRATDTLSATATIQATVTLPATATVQATATLTATAAPDPAPTTTPPLPFPTAPATTPGCLATFIPAGFTGDGNHLAGLLKVNEVRGSWLQVLDLQSLVAKTLRKSDEDVDVTALSPDGGTAAWALPDFSVQLIHLPDGKVTATLTGHTAVVNALLFSPDGSRLYSAASDQTVIVWDIQKRARQSSFQPTFSPDDHPSEVLGLGISPDGKTLVTIPFDGTARTWDTATFQKVGEYPGIIAGGYNGAHARYSPDGKYLAIGLAGGPGDTSVWQADGSSKLWDGGMMGGFDFSPDSHLFAHTELDENNRYQIAIRSEDGQTVYRTIPPTSDFAMIWKLMFSPGSSTLVAIDGNLLRFWSASDGSLQETYNPPCP